MFQIFDGPENWNKNPTGFGALLDKIADNDHIQLDREIKVYVPL